MKLPPHFKKIIVEGIRKSGPACWPLLARMPRIGKYALAHVLDNRPKRAAVIQPAPLELVSGLLQGDPEAVRRVDNMLQWLGREEPSLERDAIIQAARFSDWTGRSVAVIAHWDPDGLVDAYVLHFATALRNLGYGVVLASDREVSFPAESAAPGTLPEMIDAVIHRTCPGYDFTSWKTALTALPSLFQATELLLTNDSIFAPVGDLGAVHSAMSLVECDFWGMVESCDKQPHLQSYYLVFRQAALKSTAFRQFWAQVGRQTNKEQIIRHELNLTLWLALNGLRPAAFSPAGNQLHPLLNPTHCGWDYLLETCGVPLVKRDLIFLNPYSLSLARLASAMWQRGYPVGLIEDYAARRKLLCGFSLQP